MQDADELLLSIASYRSLKEIYVSILWAFAVLLLPCENRKLRMGRPSLSKTQSRTHELCTLRCPSHLAQSKFAHTPLTPLLVSRASLDVNVLLLGLARSSLDCPRGDQRVFKLRERERERHTEVVNPLTEVIVSPLPSVTAARASLPTIPGLGNSESIPILFTQPGKMFIRSGFMLNYPFIGGSKA